jgi:acetate kinase
MKILVMNRGSSSIKMSYYDFPKLICETNIDSTHLNTKTFKDLKPDAIGHRIVHGGKRFQSALINARLKAEIQKNAKFAPLHNKADLEAIRALEKIFPKIPQVAVFDTAFHHTLDEAAYTYPGPAYWSKLGIRRYGFHGISFQYCTRHVAEILGEMPKKMVICHLGSGASLCAVKEGKSIDTTMGFTPLEGLMMDTRSGTVDPGIILYLLSRKTPKQLQQELYEKSGLLGVSGISSDMRDILKSTSPKAKLALEVYIHSLVKMIGSMIASLGGIDTLVFTGGIGENSQIIRGRVCDQLCFLNPKVIVVHTQEALEIARETDILLAR